jgi:hypothetical protein
MMQFDSSYMMQNYPEWRRQKRTRTGGGASGATPQELVQHHENEWAFSSMMRTANYKKQIWVMPFYNDRHGADTFCWHGAEDTRSLAGNKIRDLLVLFPSSRKSIATK